MRRQGRPGFSRSAGRFTSEHLCAIVAAMLNNLLSSRRAMKSFGWAGAGLGALLLLALWQTWGTLNTRDALALGAVALCCLASGYRFIAHPQRSLDA